MTVPVRTLSVVPASRARRGWVGLCLSIVCFLHCAGGVALIPLLPAALSFLIESEVVEWGLFALSVVLAGRLVWKERPRLQRRWKMPLGAWATITSLGGVGLALESEALLQCALALLAVLQLCLVIGRRGRGNGYV